MCYIMSVQGLVDYDSCKVQRIGHSLYLLIPSELAEDQKVKPGARFGVFKDPKNGAIVYKPKEDPAK